MIEVAVEMAKASTPPAVAARYQNQNLRLLISICRALQQLKGREPFHLACRKAGEFLDISKDEANALLHVLADEGILKLVAKGSISARGKLASRWRFIAPLD